MFFHAFAYSNNPQNTANSHFSCVRACCNPSVCICSPIGLCLCDIFCNIEWNVTQYQFIMLMNNIIMTTSENQFPGFRLIAN